VEIFVGPDCVGLTKNRRDGNVVFALRLAEQLRVSLVQGPHGGYKADRLAGRAKLPEGEPRFRMVVTTSGDMGKAFHGLVYASRSA